MHPFPCHAPFRWFPTMKVVLVFGKMDVGECHKFLIFCTLQAELDRFCNTLIAIREEIKAIEDGTVDK